MDKLELTSTGVAHVIVIAINITAISLSASLFTIENGVWLAALMLILTVVLDAGWITLFTNDKYEVDENE